MAKGPYGLGLWVMALVVCRSAFGYIDPGSGGLIFQLLLGALVGLMFYVKSIGRLMKRLVKRSKAEPAPETKETEPPRKQANR